MRTLFQNFTQFNKIFLILTLLIPLSSFSQSSELWGVTVNGGQFDGGTIFKANSDATNLEVVHDFSQNEGAEPQYLQLSESPNGKLYGMTLEGGNLNINKGVIFEYDPVSNNYRVVFRFNEDDGERPQGSLFLASNGMFYGMTSVGGTGNSGVIFEYDPTNDVFTKKMDFNNTILKGRNPSASFTEVNGKLYGTASGGGSNNAGILFEYDYTTNTFIKKHDFDAVNTGQAPYGDLITVGQKLFGTTLFGGTLNRGALFEFDLATTIMTKRHDFDGNNTGLKPYGQLVEMNGKLYGMTSDGGTGFAYQGVLFEYDPNSALLSKKLDFDSADKGSTPYGSLLVYNNKLYGMTLAGGSSNNGLIFEYDPVSGVHNKLFDFDVSTAFTLEHLGKYPKGTLMLSSNGMFYGVTSEGGIYNSGVLFEFNPASSTYTKKIDFNYSENGYYPSSELAQNSNSKLFGITQHGGLNDDGVLFEYDPTSDLYVKKADFENESLGKEPKGGLVEFNGKFYGITRTGGSKNYGTIFEYDPIINQLTKKHDFDNLNGRYPQVRLIKASNNKLYGTTAFGGDFSSGVFFEYDPLTNGFNVLHNFDATGRYPYSTLIELDNKLLGTANQGGTFGDGVIYQYDLNSSIFSVIYNFQSNNFPYGGLTLACNNKLYGFSTFIGSGNIFEFDPSTNSLSGVYQLSGDGLEGFRPSGNFLQGSNLKLYATTGRGGLYDKGVLFEFEPNTYVFNKKVDFNGTNGANPSFFLKEFGDGLQPITPDEVLLPEIISCDEISLSPPTAKDICFKILIASTDTVFPITASTTVLWTYVDSYGNSLAQEQNIIIETLDSDNDTVPDCRDNCPNDPNKVEPGECGCGVEDIDTDGDGTLDCFDECPNDPNKIAPGDCGCGVSDIDTDGDGTLDCFDECPNDPNKIVPGDCGCGVEDIDTDGDGTLDCFDECPNDPNKIAPGDCGCGVEDIDTDGDGTLDCFDECPNDPNKIVPGDCGCDLEDIDTDGDGTPDCKDNCPNDPNKVEPGDCGCGVSDIDTDGDGTLDCFDECPNDPNKIVPGDCGCGVEDIDTDGDGTPDCRDNCPNDPNKVGPGECGCGVEDIDTDGDGTLDCFEICDSTLAGNPCDDGDPCTVNDVYDPDCGCSGVLLDSDGDTVPDCDDICPGFDDLVDTDGDGIPDGCDTCDSTLEGKPCDDSDPCTVNDVYDADCGCSGVLLDSDGDTVPDCDDICPGFDDLVDTDGDGTPDGCDTCDSTLAGNPCDDGDPCTVKDVYDADCGCSGVLLDSDGDTLPDCEDICPGFDDLVDNDGNGIPDACEDSVNCETAFAKGDMSTCFIDNGFNRWGWTNQFENEGNYTMNLYAGAGQCDLDNGDLVGTIELDYFDNNVTANYKLNSGYSLIEVHLYIGCDPYPKKGKKNTVAPGNYSVVVDELNNLSNFEIGPLDVSNLDDEIYVIAHAVVCQSTYENSNQFESYMPENEILCSKNSKRMSKIHDIVFHPNPVSNILYISSLRKIELLEMYDIKGRLIVALKDVNQFYINTFEDGIYFVKVITSEGQFTKKIVIKK